MTDVKPSKPSLVKGRRLLVVLLLSIIVVLAVRAACDVWMGRRLNEELARLDKEHGPLQWDPVRKLDAWKKWPRRTAPENRARLLDAAAARVITGTEKNETDLHDRAMPRGDMARELAGQNRPAVELAIQAARLRHSSWEISYGAELLNVPNLMDLGSLSRVLICAAEASVEAGRADEAMEALAAGFAEAAAMRSEPAPVMMVNAHATAFDQINALKDILDRTEPSAAALSGLAAAIDENLDGHPARPALLGELKHTRASWPFVERGWLWGRRSLDHSVPSQPSGWMRAVGWFFRPVIRYMALRDLGAWARALDAVNLPRAQRPKDMQPSSPPRQSSERPSTVQMAAGLIDSGDSSLAQMRLSAIAVALRRFRLDRGAYPNALDELVPAFFKAVPLDPFTGRPPEYKRDGAGFVVRAAIPTRRLPPRAHTVPGYRNPAEWKLSR